MVSFKHDWEILLKSEALAHTNEAIAEVVSALNWNTTALPRLIFMFMERADWQATDADVMHLLFGVFHRIGDTLVIENIHKGLRRLGKHSQNEIISRTKRMYHTATAQVLDSRAIPTVRIPHEQIARESLVGRKSMKRTFLTRSFKMPKEISRIMLPRTWSSPSASHLANTVSAWKWLQAFWSGDRRCSPDAAWWSRLVPPRTIMNVGEQGFVMVLSSVDWGSLIWQLDCIFEKEDANMFTFRPLERPIEWGFVTDPDAVSFVPYQAIGPVQASSFDASLASGGIVLQHTEKPRTLYVADLESRVNLTVVSLRRILTHLKFDVSSSTKRNDLLRTFAEYAFKGYPDANSRVDVALGPAPDMTVDDADKEIMDELIEHDPDFHSDLRDMEKMYQTRKRRELQGLQEDATNDRNRRSMAMRCNKLVGRRRRKDISGALAEPPPIGGATIATARHSARFSAATCP